MSLFVLSSKDGWVNIMYQGLDAVGLDQQVLGVAWSAMFIPAAETSRSRCDAFLVLLFLKTLTAL